METTMGEFVDKGRVHKTGKEVDLAVKPGTVQMWIGWSLFLVMLLSLVFLVNNIFIGMLVTGLMVTGAVVACAGQVRREIRR